jgi:hypothetical protein
VFEQLRGCKEKFQSLGGKENQLKETIQFIPVFAMGV